MTANIYHISPNTETARHFMERALGVLGNDSPEAEKVTDKSPPIYWIQMDRVTDVQDTVGVYREVEGGGAINPEPVHNLSAEEYHRLWQLAHLLPDDSVERVKSPIESPLSAWDELTDLIAAQQMQPYLSADMAPMTEAPNFDDQPEPAAVVANPSNGNRPQAQVNKATGTKSFVGGAPIAGHPQDSAGGGQAAPRAQRRVHVPPTPPPKPIEAERPQPPFQFAGLQMKGENFEAAVLNLADLLDQGKPSPGQDPGADLGRKAKAYATQIRQAYTNDEFEGLLGIVKFDGGEGNPSRRVLALAPIRTSTVGIGTGTGDVQSVASSLEEAAIQRIAAHVQKQLRRK